MFVVLLTLLPQCKIFPNALLGQCKVHILDIGFKRLVSGIIDENRKEHLQVAYRWIHSWMYHLETVNEYVASVNGYHVWLYREKKEGRLDD